MWLGKIRRNGVNERLQLIFEVAENYLFVTAISQDGCEAPASIVVVVKGYPIEDFNIPNAFTPNGDGINDCFGLRKANLNNPFQFKIYNRWGNLVYYSSPYNNDWNGTVNRGTTIDGKDGKVPVGTYFYIIKLNEGDKPPFKGYIDVQY